MMWNQSLSRVKSPITNWRQVTPRKSAKRNVSDKFQTEGLLRMMARREWQCLLEIINYQWKIVDRRNDWRMDGLAELIIGSSRGGSEGKVRIEEIKYCILKGWQIIKINNAQPSLPPLNHQTQPTSHQFPPPPPTYPTHSDTKLFN